MADNSVVHAEVVQTEGLTFVGRGIRSNSRGSVRGLGRGRRRPRAGATPMELLLLALGGCTSMDVVSILTKMKASFTGFRVELTGEKAPEHPKK